MDYVVLVQDGVMTIENVPADVQGEATKWLEYFQAPAKKVEVNHEQHA